MVANLKQIRMSRMMTQEELSKATGINRVTIAKYEAGIIDPTVDKAKKLAETLGVTIDELITDGRSTR